MSKVEILTGITQYVGVAISLVGAFVVSPAGAERLARDLRASVIRASNAARSWLARWMPWLRRTPQGGASGTLHLSGVGSGVAFGQARLSTVGGSIEEQLEQLRQEFEAVRNRIDALEERLTARLAAAEESITELREELRTQVSELRAAVDQLEQEAAETDARALPVVGIGVLLSGAPRLFAEFLPFPAWCVVMLLIAAWVTQITWSAIREHRTARRERAARAESMPR